MTQPSLTIDLDAIIANWRALDALSAPSVETGAVVKADAYGTGCDRVATALARAGARRFFVATPQEGAALRATLGPGPDIFVFSGHMPGTSDIIADMTLTPLLNSLDQMLRHVEALPTHPFGIQLDTGMNRLGMEPSEWGALRDIALSLDPRLVMSHLACADAPEHEMNASQLHSFLEMTQSINAPRSLSATGGILLGPDYHFDMTRPGVGLYGARPFEQGSQVLRLDVPVIQTREVSPGETVGYANAWSAERPSRVATVAAGYADGILRAIGEGARLYAGETPCPIIGRISMDLITVDVTDLDTPPQSLSLICPQQGVDALADAGGTIGYEILTSLGGRYARRYIGG